MTIAFDRVADWSDWDDTTGSTRLPCRGERLMAWSNPRDDRHAFETMNWRKAKRLVRKRIAAPVNVIWEHGRNALAETSRSPR